MCVLGENCVHVCRSSVQRQLAPRHFFLLLKKQVFVQAVPRETAWPQSCEIVPTCEDQI